MLEATPAEVLAMIIAEVTDVKDLHNLCKVSRRLYDAAMPFLYKTVEIATPETALECVDSHRIHEASRPHLKLTKYLHVSAPFCKFLRRRCIHGEKSKGKEIEFENIGRALLPILKQLSDDQLRGFSWNLGTCLPKTLFDEQGYIATRQTRVETLSLITDCECFGAQEEDYSINLSNFSSIRTFSWIGVKSDADFDALQRCVAQNASHLVSLTLDLINWEHVEDDWYGYGGYHSPHLPRLSNFLANDIFKLEGGIIDRLFPSLDELYLSNVSFHAAGNKMAHALNFENLRKLKLWNCPYSIRSLCHVVEQNELLRLTSFEFVKIEVYSKYMDYDGLEEFCPFIEAFRGLEDIFLLSHWPLALEKLTSAMLNHKSTISRVVLHRREKDLDDDISDSQEPMDWSLDWSSEMESLFLLPKLECIGLCIEISLLQKGLSHLNHKPCCKLLHIRASGASELRSDGWLSGPRIDNESESRQGDGVEEDKNSDDSQETGKTNSPERTSEEDQETSTISQLHAEGEKVDVSDSRSPQNLWNFAHWAFGSDGLPNLQFLVYGDFCHKGRYTKHNILLCRQNHFQKDVNPRTPEQGQSGLTFRELRRGETILSELYRLHGDFLEACAAESFMQTVFE